MSTNANALFNRIQITFYSILISLLSGVNRIRTLLERATGTGQKREPAKDSHPIPGAAEMSVPETINPSRPSFGQVLVSIMIWTVMGFAAGFLFGMINPR